MIPSLDWNEVVNQRAAKSVKRTGKTPVPANPKARKSK